MRKLTCELCKDIFTSEGRRPRRFCSGCRYKYVAKRLSQYYGTPEGHEARIKAGHGNAGKPKLGSRDEKHWAWKGDAVGYHSLHNWVKRRLGKADSCEHCGVEDAAVYDWSNISGEYKRELSDWQQLCRSCHQVYDDVKARSWLTRKATKHV